MILLTNNFIFDLDVIIKGYLIYQIKLELALGFTLFVYD